MKTKVRMIIMSHLSDLQEGYNHTSHTNINYIKWLLLRYSHTDLNVEVDAEKEFKIFKNYSAPKRDDEGFQIMPNLKLKK